MELLVLHSALGLVLELVLELVLVQMMLALAQVPQLQTKGSSS
jgi:hypothetical protein